MHLLVDVLAPESMKTEVKFYIQWELQKYETHQVVERICGRGSPSPCEVECRLKNVSRPNLGWGEAMSVATSVDSD